MKGLNRWSAIGNVGQDPEVRYTASNTAVANFSIAVNSKWKDQDGNLKEHVEWINVVVWKALADIVGKYLKKGDPVFVEGKAQTSSWEKDGVKRYKTELVAENLILLGKKDDGAVSRPEPGTDAPPVRQEEEPLPF